MNVQISPPNTPTGTRPDDGDDRSHLRTYVVGGAALVLALGGFWYFTHAGDGAKPRRNVAAPVRVAVAQIGTMPVIERTIGTVLANSTVSVNARIQGQMIKAFFKEGQMVKAGDPLFQIDPRPYQAALAQALANQAHDQAQLTGAEQQTKRYTSLTKENAIAPSVYEAAVGNSRALAASVVADKAAVDMARLNLEFTLIRAPVTGKTGAILIQPGNMVAASTASTSATPLVTINEIQPVKISLSLPQSDLPRIQAMQHKGGLTITINMHDAGGGDDLVAPVDFIGNAVTNTTGTIELRANYANADLALVPGQLVDVTVALSEIPHATIVPREAVNTGPDGQFVYAVRNSAAQQVMVKVLFDDGTNDAISGEVHKGDQVIVDGQLRVIPGAKVSVTGAKPHASKGVLTSGRRRVKHAQDNEG
jgi:membrane fusion protein, multidrug efflux system